MTRNFAPSTLFHCDNLDVLRGMNTGTVDLIATDPPFNKSRDFHATPSALKGAQGARFEDRWRWHTDVQQAWVDGIKDSAPKVWSVIDTARTAWGDDMGAFLCWLGVRLMECHRVLAPHGSLWLHIDHTAHAYVKVLLDAVFGRRRFEDAVTWARAAENLSRRKWRRATETLLWYSRGPDRVFNPLFEPLGPERIAQDYRHEDERGRYTTTSCTNNARRPNMIYRFHGVKRQWRYTRETMEQFEREGLLIFNDAGVPRRKRYLTESPGRRLTNVWSDIPALTSRDAQRTGYPTQKPLALYERIIAACSCSGDLVLDPFAGCATTLVAASRLGRDWVGADLWDGAAGLVRERLETDGVLSEVGSLALRAVRTERTPPARTDEGETTAEPFRLVARRQPEPWERLAHAEIRALLLPAQRDARQLQDLVVCAGCGRSLEAPFMELDHRLPKADGGRHTIDNRVLLCRPCNGFKGDALTLSGLMRRNTRDGWMVDRAAAKSADERARAAADRARQGFVSP